MWLVYAVLAAIIWGLCYTLDERVFKSHISPLTLLAFTALAGTVVFFILAYFSKLKPDLVTLTHDKKVLWLTIAAIATANIGTFFIALSIQAKNATFAALIELSYPLFTILFAWILFKENYFNFKVMLGGTLIMTGAALISFAG